MSDRAVQHVRRRWVGLPASQRLALLMIAQAYNDEADEARIMRRDLAEACGASSGATFEAVDNLVARGLLVVERRRGAATRYLFPDLTRPWLIQEVVGAPTTSRKVAAVEVVGAPNHPLVGTPTTTRTRQVVGAPTISAAEIVGAPTTSLTPGEGTARSRGATPPPDPRRIGASADGVSAATDDGARTNSGQDAEQMARELAHAVEARTAGRLSAQRALPAASVAVGRGLPQDDAVEVMAGCLERTGYATTGDLVHAIRSHR